MIENWIEKEIPENAIIKNKEFSSVHHKESKTLTVNIELLTIEEIGEKVMIDTINWGGICIVKNTKPIKRNNWDR